VVGFGDVECPGFEHVGDVVEEFGGVGVDSAGGECVVSGCLVACSLGVDVAGGDGVGFLEMVGEGFEG
jgi:hypothetical protein